ncbi:hypothetical protein ACHAWF_016050 [Thalassiosira exigua]
MRHGPAKKNRMKAEQGDTYPTSAQGIASYSAQPASVGCLCVPNEDDQRRALRLRPGSGSGRGGRAKGRCPLRPAPPVAPPPAYDPDDDCNDDCNDDCDDEESPTSRSRLMSRHHFSQKTARKVLSRRSSSIVDQSSDVELVCDLVEGADIRGWVVWQWNRWYRMWWHLTALGAVVTIFMAPYLVAFDEGPRDVRGGAGKVFETILNVVFCADVVVNFNLARYKDGTIVYDREEIAREYVREMFWVDVAGIFPFFQRAVLIVAGDSLDELDVTALMISSLRLFQAARLHRIQSILDQLRYKFPSCPSRCSGTSRLQR